MGMSYVHYAVSEGQWRPVCGAPVIEERTPRRESVTCPACLDLLGGGQAAAPPPPTPMPPAERIRRSKLARNSDPATSKAAAATFNLSRRHHEVLE